ncbi:MAG: N-6 DNA methylase [Candidatus Riflebacteria bacterium]|nr:N-6 DNA methylase [Candidatus Riflebacteria bacterium]
MTVTQDIVAKLWNFCNILKDDGVTYHQYVTELTYLLFLKMMKETDREKLLPEKYRWDKLMAINAEDRLEGYRTMLIQLGNSSHRLIREIFAGASTFIKHPRNLTTLMENINQLDWFEAKKEGLGDLYEGLLEKNANEKKSGAGQYFTPRVLIDVMVRLMQPKYGEIIQDPAAGTAGFLISASHYMQAKKEVFELSEAEYERFKNNTFYGMEHVQDAHRLGVMNMILHGLDGENDSAGLLYGDTLSPTGQNLPLSDVILTNPPFGSKKGGGLPTRDDFTFNTSNKQLAFLQHIYRHLKPGGRAAVVLPDNVLFEGNVGKSIRQDLMNKCNLHTILRLPTGIFYAQGVKTNVLFFTRGKTEKNNTSEVWVYDLRTNMANFGKTNTLKIADFADFEKCFGNDPHGKAKRTDQGETGRFRMFSRKHIADRDDSLDISWLRDDSQQDADSLPEPDILAKEAAEELEAGLEDLNNILAELTSEVEP